MSSCGEGAEWVEQLRAPHLGHCTSQSHPVKATLLRRAVTLCATIPRRLRRQNGLIWYYLVRDNFFVSGLDWGTIILAQSISRRITSWEITSVPRPSLCWSMWARVDLPLPELPRSRMSLCGFWSWFTVDTSLLSAKFFRLHHIIGKKNLSIKTGINNLKNERSVNSAFHPQQSIDFPFHGCYTAT